jgi:threonine/homoserine/homoserine lactone efflux protein
LGLISVTLNTLADIMVVALAARARDSLSQRPTLIRRMREAAGVVMCGLGASLMLARRST